ncbi:cyclin delta-3 [Trifolium repens]|nr:cyclin delta-3 [Trifolium repens]
MHSTISKSGSSSSIHGLRCVKFCRDWEFWIINWKLVVVERINRFSPRQSLVFLWCKLLGIFPDVLKRKQHFDEGDQVSALVTGEFYTKNEHFSGSPTQDDIRKDLNLPLAEGPVPLDIGRLATGYGMGVLVFDVNLA